MKLQKNMVYVFILATLIYFASVAMYAVNCIYMLDDRVFLITRILMMLCLFVFFLIELGSKAIAKNEEINASKIELFSRFEIFSKICSKGQILRSTPNTAPLICGACNTQPEGLSTMA